MLGSPWAKQNSAAMGLRVELSKQRRDHMAGEALPPWDARCCGLLEEGHKAHGWGTQGRLPKRSDHRQGTRDQRVVQAEGRALQSLGVEKEHGLLGVLAVGVGQEGSLCSFQFVSWHCALSEEDFGELWAALGQNLSRRCWEHGQLLLVLVLALASLSIWTSGWAHQLLLNRSRLGWPGPSRPGFTWLSGEVGIWSHDSGTPRTKWA